MQIIDIYIGKVKKEIYKLSPADDFLNELKSNLIVRRNGKPISEMDQVDMPDPIAVELECLRRRVVELEDIIVEKLGVELAHECHEDCQYPNILREMEDGSLNRIYDETNGEIVTETLPDSPEGETEVKHENL